jgi:hypothetical protein
VKLKIYICARRKTFCLGLRRASGGPVSRLMIKPDFRDNCAPAFLLWGVKEPKRNWFNGSKSATGIFISPLLMLRFFILIYYMKLISPR